MGKFVIKKNGNVDLYRSANFLVDITEIPEIEPNLTWAKPKSTNKSIELFVIVADTFLSNVGEISRTSRNRRK